MLFLLVLVSLGAHLLADIQPFSAGFQTDLDACLLHGAMLLPVLEISVAALAIGPIIAQPVRSHHIDNPPPFHPPAL